MLFKNLSVFRLTEPFSWSPEQMADKLSGLTFKPCSAHQEKNFGWTAPVGQSLAHSCNGFVMVCGKQEEKVLPAAVVNELLQEKITAAEDRQGKKLSKKDKSSIKDELMFELLPRAFSFSRKTYAYVDTKSGWLIVDAASAKAAEELLSNLRKCLGSLPVVPLNTVAKPIETMTAWLSSGDVPENVTIADECELRSPEEAGGIIRCKRHDLAVPEIKNHLESGKQVIKLALNWSDRIAFVLDENLAMKRLKFLDVLQDEIADIEAEDETARFDADFSVMSLEIAHLLPHLLEWFGGENRS